MSDVEKLTHALQILNKMYIIADVICIKVDYDYFHDRVTQVMFEYIDNFDAEPEFTVDETSDQYESIRLEKKPKKVNRKSRPNKRR